MTILLKTNILSRLKGEANNNEYILNVEKIVNFENMIDFSYETSYGYVVAETINGEKKLTKYDQNLEPLPSSDSNPNPKILSRNLINSYTIKTSDDGFASYYNGNINIFDKDFNLTQSFAVDNPYEMLQSIDGNYLIARKNYIDDKNVQFIIKKYNLNGEILLTKTYDMIYENGNYDIDIYLNEDNEGNIILGICSHINDVERITRILKWDNKDNNDLLLNKVINGFCLDSIKIKNDGNYLLKLLNSEQVYTKIISINNITGEEIDSHIFNDSVIYSLTKKKNSNNYVFAGIKMENEYFYNNFITEIDEDNNVIFDLYDKTGIVVYNGDIYHQNENKYVIIGNTLVGGEKGRIVVYNKTKEKPTENRLDTKSRELSFLERIDSKVELDDGFVFIGKMEDESGVYAIKFNNNYEILGNQKKLLVDNETEIYCDVCKAFKLNNEIGIFNKSGDKLHFYDNDFNFIETINLDGNYEKIKLTDDGNYLLESYDEIAKYDTSKNKIYGFNIEDRSSFNCIAHEDKSGNVVYSEAIFSEEENENGDWFEYYNGTITKYDTKGNILKKIEFKDRAISPVAKVDDKYILVGIKTDFNDPENMMNNYENKLYTINDNLEIINEQTINEFSLYSSYAVNNENEIIFVGGVIDSDFSKISLIKSDSNGNIIWNSKDENFNLGKVYPDKEIFVGVNVNDKDEVRLSLEVEGKEKSKYYLNEYKPRYYIDGYDRRYTKGEKVVLNSEDSKNINNLKITSKYNNKDVSNIISYDKENSSIIMPGYDISIASNTIDLPDIGDIGDIEEPDDVENSSPNPSSTKTTTKKTTLNKFNPITYDNIMNYFIIGGMSIILLTAGVIIYIKKRK